MRTLACLTVLGGGILVAAHHAGALLRIDAQANVAAEPTIYVSNDSVLSDTLVRTTLPVLQAAVDRDVAPAWNEWVRGSWQEISGP